MATNEPITSTELAAGVEVVERLLEAADGGRTVRFGEYQASTILAMFGDPVYRKSVFEAHSAMPPDSLADSGTERLVAHCAAFLLNVPAAET